MEVIINEIVSSVRAVDSETLLAPETLNRILHAVLEAVREQQEHQDRVSAEQRVSLGVSHEMAED